MSANGGEAAELPIGDATAELPAAAEPEITAAALAVDEAQAESEIRPEVAVEEPTSPPGHGKGSKLQSSQGGRTFTMRELLNDLKEGRGESSPRQSGGSGLDDRRGRNSPLSQESPHRHGHNDAAMELINSVTGVDEEGRSRQRVLVFAAKRYASAIERNPHDYDALYNWALVLQESADNVSPDSSSPSKDALLEEACRKYDEATRLSPTLHDAFYNWAIAISDRAKMRGRTKEAEELWKQATKNYERAVQLNWNSPQALNNWGLALQELSAIVPAREKQTIIRTAIHKYGLAEDTVRTGRPSSTKNVSPNELYSQSAIYIAAAHALKPNYSVYRSALRLVRSMLPLPYLKVGYLTAPPVGDPVAPHGDWKRSQFVLNHEGLLQIKIEQKQLSQSPSGKLQATVENPVIKVEVPDIVSVSACADLTLPPGAGFSIDTIRGPIYLVADTWEAVDGWLDAIRLVYTIYARGKSDVLAGVITG